MTKLFYLIAVLSWSVASQAELRLACQLDGNRQTYQFLEQPLAFQPAANGTFKSRHVFLWDALPGYESVIELTEGVNAQGNLEWKSTWITRRLSDNRVIARWKDDTHEFQIGERYYQLYCNAYSKTLTLTPPEPTSERERQRLKLAGGPGHTRTYAGIHHFDHQEMDIWDLWHQLRRLNSEESRILAQTVQRVTAAGFMATPLHTYERYVMTGVFQKVGTNSESFEIVLPFIRPNPTGQDHTEDAYVRVIGLIFREPGSRVIRGYRIDKVVTSIVNKPGGGNANTSGGRIKPNIR